MARADHSKRLNKAGLHPVRVQQLLSLERKMRKVRNEMDFLEILTNFWPINNMEARVQNLEAKMYSLNENYIRLGNPFDIVAS